jgi:hypothetical protein
MGRKGVARRTGRRAGGGGRARGAAPAPARGGARGRARARPPACFRVWRAAKMGARARGAPCGAAGARLPRSNAKEAGDRGEKAERCLLVRGAARRAGPPLAPQPRAGCSRRRPAAAAGRRGRVCGWVGGGPRVAARGAAAARAYRWARPARARRRIRGARGLLSQSEGAPARGRGRAVREQHTQKRDNTRNKAPAQAQARPGGPGRGELAKTLGRRARAGGVAGGREGAARISARRAPSRPAPRGRTAAWGRPPARPRGRGWRGEESLGGSSLRAAPARAPAGALHASKGEAPCAVAAGPGGGAAGGSCAALGAAGPRERAGRLGAQGWGLAGVWGTALLRRRRGRRPQRGARGAVPARGLGRAQACPAARGPRCAGAPLAAASACRRGCGPGARRPHCCGARAGGGGEPGAAAGPRRRRRRLGRRPPPAPAAAAAGVGCGGWVGWLQVCAQAIVRRGRGSAKSAGGRVLGGPGGGRCAGARRVFGGARRGRGAYLVGRRPALPAGGWPPGAKNGSGGRRGKGASEQTGAGARRAPGAPPATARRQSRRRPSPAG